MEENRWESTRNQKEKIIPTIKKFMEKVSKNPKTEEYIDFYNQRISPSQLKDILENELGFEEVDFDTNGWQWDFWITMRKNGVDYMIAGTGMTFEMIFRLA